MIQGAALHDNGRGPWLALAAALLCAALYIPTLGIRFDFCDDGALVYPEPTGSVADSMCRTCSKSIDEFHVRGPFRPVCWAHWDLEAQLFGDQLLARRLVRVLWAALSAALFLTWLRALDIAPAAAFLTTLFAFANPSRSEIFMTFGLTEAFAYPYAMLALLAATRAARSARAWRWDAVALGCLVACLGIKNVYAALIPALLVLRVLGGGLPWGESLRRSPWSAVLYASTALLPIAHFVLFKLTPHTDAYHTTLSARQAASMAAAVLGAANRDYIAPGLVLAALAIWMGRASNGPSHNWKRQRTTLLAAATLLFFGIGIYVPIGGSAGRYTIPAVWGADLMLAVLLTRLEETAGNLRRLAYVALALGLVVAAVGNLGRQSKLAARNEVIWQALTQVERDAAAGARVAWLGVDALPPRSLELSLAEGQHFLWHLHGRGRSDLGVERIARPGREPAGVALVVAGEPPAEARGTVTCYRASYWLGLGYYQCCVWAGPAALDAGAPDEAGNDR